MLKFFLNSQTKSYLRSLANEFGESTNAIRLELNHLEKAGLLAAKFKGNKKMFFANVYHPLFEIIRNLLNIHIGIDQIIEKIISQIGTLEAAYLSGDLAIGHDSESIELLLVGDISSREYIENLVHKSEHYISRKIQYVILTQEEMRQFSDKTPVLLIWNSELWFRQYERWWMARTIFCNFQEKKIKICWPTKKKIRNTSWLK